MEPQTKVICECCELSVPSRLASPDCNAFGLVRGWICRQCNDHRADPQRKAQEHEEEVRVRWGETADELNDALDRADDYNGGCCPVIGTRRASSLCDRTRLHLR
jgi:hypothetical protein